MTKDFKIGDSVVTKPDTTDPDMGGDISGWQGRIVDIHQDEKSDPSIVMIKWDSITLRKVPESVIIHCDREGLDWSEKGLYIHEVIPTKTRDTEQDTTKVRAEIHSQYGWIGVGNDEAQGRRIQAVVNSAHNHDMMAILEAWDTYLEDNLTLPFKAEIYEPQDRGPLRAGDKVKVLSISDFDDSYGSIVKVRAKRGNFHFPLCDLEVSNKNSPNHPLVADYRLWFANR
jgi:hypothetical protein